MQTCTESDDEIKSIHKDNWSNIDTCSSNSSSNSDASDSTYIDDNSKKDCSQKEILDTKTSSEICHSSNNDSSLLNESPFVSPTKKRNYNQP